MKKDTSYTAIRHGKLWEAYLVLKQQYGGVFKDLPRNRINAEAGEIAGYNPEYAGKVINKLLKQHGN